MSKTKVEVRHWTNTEREYCDAAAAACRAAGLTLDDLTPERLREAMAALRMVELMVSSKEYVEVASKEFAHGKCHYLSISGGDWCVREFYLGLGKVLHRGTDLTAALTIFDGKESPDA